jgi:alpha-L-fucosidase 2
MPEVLNPDDRLVLRYAQPASRWNEALPLGNGRLGAMIFGGFDDERLQLNEATLWSGGVREWNNPKAKTLLPQVRAAIFAGDYVKAGELSKGMQGPYNESYQPLGDLRLAFSSEATIRPVEYERTLFLDRAVTTVRFRRGDALFMREAFSSYPDQVIAMRLTCDKPGRLSFDATADSPLRHKVASASADTLAMCGKTPSHVDPSYLESSNPILYEEGADAKGVSFALCVRVLADGGTTTCEVGMLSVRNASAVTLLLSAGTNFDGRGYPLISESLDPADAAMSRLDAAESKGYDELLARHTADHQELFRRVELDLGEVSGAKDLTTDERLARFANGDPDPSLATLLFQYGRYLLIANSRPGGLPANLQGIWNDSMRPPWSSNWTLNINAEMNYWPSEVANLAECHEPFLDFIQRLSVNGRKTAEINYGARGWVAHHNADIWGQTGPAGNYGGGDPVWASWAMGGAWLSLDFWEHYAFGGDVSFLRDRGWPVMKGAAEFCLICARRTL